MMSNGEDEIILAKFKNHLYAHSDVSDDKIGYYIGWIRKYLQYTRNFSSNKNQLIGFKNSLALSNKYPDILLKQAEHAVSLFIKLQSSQQTKSRVENFKVIPDIWASLIVENQNQLRLMHRSLQTEKSYQRWLKDFIRFVSKTPESVDTNDIKNFLTHLAVNRKVAQSTQRQAFNALLFFYRHILHRDIDSLSGTVVSTKTVKLPVVLTKSEVL